MSDFPSRLKFAITNYALGAISYKGFAGLIDVPYRTLQNYLSGERSPNLEALEKLANNGININWLITGIGTPYLHTELERSLLDKVMLLHGPDIVKTAFSSEMYDRSERARLITFVSGNNYLRIGDVIHALWDEGVYSSIEELDKALGSGELDELFDNPPKNRNELWKALQVLKEARSREVVPVRDIEGEEVGE